MVKMLMILNVVSVVLMTPFFVVQLVYCWAAAWHDGRGGPYTAAEWLFFASAAAKPLVYVTLNANFRRGCREVMCMSAMRCYRRHAYTITTTSTLAKKNHVGVAAIAPTRDHHHHQQQQGAVTRTTELGGVSWPGSTGNVTAAAVDSTSFLRRAAAAAAGGGAGSAAAAAASREVRTTTFSNYSRVLEPPERLRNRCSNVPASSPTSTYV